VVGFYDQREHGMLFLQRLKRGISGSNGNGYGNGDGYGSGYGHENGG
jgi:hypothetical protein